jgi:DNA polymerase III epsilon subunit family exonuclease
MASHTHAIVQLDRCAGKRRRAPVSPLERRRSPAAVDYDPPFMSRPLVVFDTECATAHGAPHLLEIGAVRAVDGEIVDHFEALVRPEVPIEAEAIEVHGIDEDMVRDARPAAEVIAEFVAFAGEDWLVAHSVMHDAQVLGFEAARHGLALPDTTMIDTLKLVRHCVPDAADHKLDTLVGHFDIEADVQHRALADAVSCWKVMEECLELLTLPDDTVRDRERLLLELVARAGTRVTLAKAGPKMPRLSQRLRRLERACRGRERVTLVYGIEEVPAQLVVSPRVLYQMGDKGYLEAECVRSGLIKTYRLDRVVRVVG